MPTVRKIEAEPAETLYGDLEALIYIAKQVGSTTEVTLWVKGAVISGVLCSRQQWFAELAKVWGPNAEQFGRVPADDEGVVYLIEARYDSGLYQGEKVTTQVSTEIGAWAGRIASVDGWALRSVLH